MYKNYKANKALIGTQNANVITNIKTAPNTGVKIEYDSIGCSLYIYTKRTILRINAAITNKILISISALKPVKYEITIGNHENINNFNSNFSSFFFLATVLNLVLFFFGFLLFTAFIRQQLTTPILYITPN